jgi:hypothetical protein
MHRQITQFDFSANTRRVRAANNLAQIIGQYVRLKRSGHGNLVGLCPFHQEKTPSFTISTEKQLYHCHGCGAGGDVITFVQQIEGISFIEARKALAERCGLALDDERPLTPEERRMEAQDRRYAEQVGLEAAVYWQHVRDRYQSRMDTLIKIGAGCAARSEDPWWESRYQEYARRAWRWGKIIRRLNDLGPFDRGRRYERIRRRPEVMRIIERYHAVDRIERESWDAIRNAAREGRLTADQTWRIAAAVYSGDAGMARRILRSESVTGYGPAAAVYAGGVDGAREVLGR